MADDIVKRLRAAARAGDLPLGVSFDCDAVADEIERLRQGIWDACIALGMDTDGNDTPRHLVFPPLADLIVREAQRARQDYDELLDELSEARRG